MKNLLIFTLCFFLFSCSNSEGLVTKSLSIEIKNTFGDKAIILGAKDYKINDSTVININTLKYYLSNIKLHKGDASSFEDKESFYLINALNQTNTIEINNIPNNDYSSLDFSIGVDSLHNHRADHLIPALSPTNGMAWSWKQGYKFFVLEGKYTVTNSKTGSFVFHIGTDPLFRTLSTKTYDINKKLVLELKLEGIFQSIDVTKHSHLREGLEAEKFMNNLVSTHLLITQ